MKQLFFFGVALSGFAALAGIFPYAQSMTTRYEAGETEFTSFDDPAQIPSVNGGMQGNEDIAVFESPVSDFAASDAENWAAGTAAVGNPQASLSMRCANGALVWMGYVGGSDESWRELAGPAAEEGAWQVKIEIDYTAARRVRYSVKRPADADYAVLRSGDDEWLPLGGEDMRVSSVKLYGSGVIGGLVGKCAARPIEGTVAASESFSMKYDNLVVSTQVSDVWGAESVRVTLKDADGKIVKAVDGVISGDTITADFSDVARPGESYSYDIVLMGRGQEVEAKADAPVGLFSNIDWFGFRNGSFVKSSARDIDVSGQSFAAADVSAGEVTPQTSSSENAETVVETRLVVDGAYAWDALPRDDVVQFALLLARDGNGQRKWTCRTGSGDWVAINTDFTTDNGTYDVKLAFDYREGKRIAVCSIKQSDDADYTELVGAIPLTAARLNGVAVRSGDFTKLAASYKTTAAAPTALDESSSQIMLASNTELDLSSATANRDYVVSAPQGKSYRLAWKDGGNAYAKMEGGVLTVTTGKPANGVDSFKSHVLGLDPEDAQSKPFLAAEQNAEPDKLVLKLPKVRQRDPSETGVAVTYRLVTSEDTSFATESTDQAVTGVPAGKSPTFKTELPTGDGKVRYYRVEIELEK